MYLILYLGGFRFIECLWMFEILILKGRLLMFVYVEYRTLLI
jgi:hypothetical protein